MSAGHAVLVLSATVVAGCTGWSVPAVTDAGAARAALAQADRDAAEGRLREAATRYEAIVREDPKDPAAADALHRLAMLRLEPGSPIRDRRAAQALLRRLAIEHPRTLSGREARVWRGLLREIDRCEAEATKRGADAEKLRQTLDSIRDTDIELEQHP
jgi:hypothetical protein